MSSHNVYCSVCRPQPADGAQHAQHSTSELDGDGQHASMATAASWPQAWPESNEQSTEHLADHECATHALAHSARVLPGQASAHRLAPHSSACTAGGLQQQQGGKGSKGAPQGVPRGGYGLSTVRGDTPSQQSCQPSSDYGQDCSDGRWQNPKRQASEAQRRLYKHGPIVPKSSAMQRPIRRRQRPEWDDHLTSAAPQAERGADREGVGWDYSPRPTAKELLQEALARIHTASSPRQQHAKRQRRGTAPQQGRPGPPDRQPQVQNGQGVGQLGSGHSWGDDATAAKAAQRLDPDQDAQQRASLTVQPEKQSMVKQPAFGRKPSWVCRSSVLLSGTAGQHGIATQPAGASSCLCLTFVYIAARDCPPCP